LLPAAIAPALSAKNPSATLRGRVSSRGTRKLIERFIKILDLIADLM
jgi:hypothetical protein